jgi:hypothetical protein
MANSTNNSDKIASLSEKFTQEEWNSIEKKFSPFELTVLECLKLLGISKDICEIKHKHTILGEDLYLFVRPLLLKKELVFPTPVKNVNVKEKTKEKIKKISSKEKIIFENARDRAKKDVETVLNSFSVSDEFRIPKYALNSKIIEIRGMGLLYAASHLYTNHSNYQKQRHLSFVFGIMVALEKYIANCENLKGKNLLGGEDEDENTNKNENLDKNKNKNVNKNKEESENNEQNTKVASTLISDLNQWLNKLKEIYTDYNGFAVHDYAPELLIFTEYDEYIPTAGIKPRRHQIEMVKKMSQNFDTGFMMAYNPPMGSGKTTSIVAICYYIMEHVRKINPKFQLIFACNLLPVKDHAASLCYNANIKFGITSKNIVNGKYKITNHFSCSKDDERIAIITSPEIAYEILRDDTNGTGTEDYLLFLDEPTVGADNLNSETLKTNMMVLSVAPKRTILSSATFPDLDTISSITDYIKQRHANIVFDTVYSNEIQIGCDIKKFNFDIVVLHYGVKTQKQLKETIETISKNPFLGRMYTSNVVRSLWKAMKIYDVKNLIDIESVFENVIKINSDNVRLIAMELLTVLSNESDDIIEKVCSCDTQFEQITLKNIEQKKMREKDRSSSSIFCDDNDEDTEYLDFDKLATSQAWLMQNTTLIATPDPMLFTEKHFYNFVKEEIYKYPINISDSVAHEYQRTEKVLKIYEKQVAEAESRRERFEKSLDNGSSKKKMMSPEDKDKSRLTKEDIDKKLQDLSDIDAKIIFPAYAHINSMEHIKKYAKQNASKLYGKNVRLPPVLESLPYHTFKVSDEILTLLFAGVGVYSTIDKSICPNYLKTVLDMASNGLLAYIISDVSICYGTNYPINRIVVTDEFATQHSMNTLFQLFGRAGRVGRSWIAMIYVSETVADKLVNYIQKIDSHNVEANNMTNVFTSCISQSTLSENSFLEYIFKKYIHTESNEVKNKVIIESKSNTVNKQNIITYTPVNESSKTLTEKQNWRNEEKVSDKIAVKKNDEKISNKQETKVDKVPDKVQTKFHVKDPKNGNEEVKKNNTGMWKRKF